MAGSFRSRFAIAALVAAAALAVATVATGTYDSCRECFVGAWRWVTLRVDRGSRWLLARMPRLVADWLRKDLIVRVRLDGALNMRAVPKRRPTVSPRWRMVPSI
jgi:hypothetical protein